MMLRIKANGPRKRASSKPSHQRTIVRGGRASPAPVVEPEAFCGGGASPAPAVEPEAFSRIDAINLFIGARGYERYLEIGCASDFCFSRVKAKHKVGVDPVSGGTVRKTSDAYFADAIAAGEKFDIVFIDGLHHHDQVYRDIENSLACLSDGGAILMHDCLPPNAAHELDPVTKEVAFCGTTWRAFVKFRERLDLDAICGDFDFGVGLIRRVKNPLPISIRKSMDELTYADFEAHRTAWMRPQPVSVFRELSKCVWGTPTVALLVIGKSDEEIEIFRRNNPTIEKEARLVCVSNPERRFGGTAAIANPFLDEAKEDVVAIVHADTKFDPGAVGVFAQKACDHNCLTGIVGRRAPDPEEPFSGYVWCSNSGGIVSTLDSCSVFFRRRLGLRFDGSTFDDFHCVVEDLCLQAAAKGIRALVPRANAYHLEHGGDNPQSWTDDFWRYRERLVKKYAGQTFYTV